jgi:hypothetical protein
MAVRLVRQCALLEMAAAFLVSKEARAWIAAFVVQAWRGEAAGSPVDVGQLPVPALAGRRVVVGAAPVPVAPQAEEGLR